ncbi:hypothetical protein [Saccharopolyspora rosea]|uniref:Beta/gamma crystallin n=1 Tax=Saccharopolyspora rosea TaxID=524884 RepID=A0ABW3FP12_9PSEU|nr:hypothetical protein [Saccharopolyspora rosea]
MRLRAIITATAGAAALLLSSPLTAGAASGSFIYHFDRGLQTQSSMLEDPSDARCHRLDLPGWEAAYRVENRTDTTAIVFQGSHCDGPWFELKPWQKAPAKVEVRSVVFLR